MSSYNSEIQSSMDIKQFYTAHPSIDGAIPTAMPDEKNEVYGLSSSLRRDSSSQIALPEMSKVMSHPQQFKVEPHSKHSVMSTLTNGTQQLSEIDTGRS